ncbi:hypothetical protein [Ralstonia pseudosolanacearum]|uniref:hypothetical protein n=1 Tax=Ralstonia pseudosolanacearum TaxID=1310165 RepID=UPI0033916FC0
MAAVLSGGTALAVTRGNTVWSKFPLIKSPTLKEGFDLAAFTGVPWGVQATIVALVYPIVVSFIALMLQRRAHSTIALRVYVLDSAVVPAGASSIGLLLAMSCQYFATPYASQELLTMHMAEGLIFNCTWLALNVLLAGFFLSRTVRFIQDDEARQAFTRLAVHTVLRTELPGALTQQFVVNAPEERWGYSPEAKREEHAPQVHMYSMWSDGNTEVNLHLRDKRVLSDVHLHLLKVVAWSWTRRARSQTPDRNRRGPAIFFPPKVGISTGSEVKLCVVRHGPPLTWIERILIRCAFVYRPTRAGTLSLTAEAMLTEVASEVESLAEQHRYSAAVDTLGVLLELHKTLLLACVADEDGTAQNAAMIFSSQYKMGARPLDTEWLTPYREISRVAVDLLDKDPSLFRRAAHVPASLTIALPIRPEKLIVNSFLVGSNLAYQLGAWWIRHAQESLASGATVFAGVLPQPKGQVYEQAVVDFIGAWGIQYPGMPDRSKSTDEEVWLALAARVQILVSHIEFSVELFLNAMSRGDEVAATWFYENFIKWCGNRAHELRHEDPDFAPTLDRVGLSIADKSWADAQQYLWDGETPVSIEFAEKALNLAIRRYWETMRLFVALLLVHRAGDDASPDTREIRFAANLIQARALKGGGRVEAITLNDGDTAATGILAACFGDEVARSRINSFAERLDWRERAPTVALWVYSWSGGAPTIDSMSLAHAKLMAAVAAPAPRAHRNSKELIERWWRDLDKLAEVAQYSRDIRRIVLSADFSRCTSTVTALRGALGHTGTLRQARRAVAATMKAQGRTALLERRLTLRAMTVDEPSIRRLVEAISALAFAFDGKKQLPVRRASFVPSLPAPLQYLEFHYDKRALAKGVNEEPDEGFLGFASDSIRANAVVGALHAYVTKESLTPVNAAGFGATGHATIEELQTFASAIVARCGDLQAIGRNPVILVGPGNLSGYLSTYRWGSNSWQIPMPPGVDIRDPDSTRGETASVYVNDVPVYELQTPNCDCYVVPMEDVESLRIGGGNAPSVLSYAWSPLGDEKLLIRIGWRAAIGN